MTTVFGKAAHRQCSLKGQCEAALPDLNSVAQVTEQNWDSLRAIAENAESTDLQSTNALSTSWVKVMIFKSCEFSAPSY